MLERDIKLNISKMTQKIVKKFSSPEKISKNFKKFQKSINLKIPLQKIKNPNFYCDINSPQKVCFIRPTHVKKQPFQKITMEAGEREKIIMF